MHIFASLCLDKCWLLVLLEFKGYQNYMCRLNFLVVLVLCVIVKGNSYLKSQLVTSVEYMLYTSGVHRDFEEQGQKRKKQLQIVFWLLRGHFTTCIGT